MKRPTCPNRSRACLTPSIWCFRRGGIAPLPLTKWTASSKPLPGLGCLCPCYTFKRSFTSYQMFSEGIPLVLFWPEVYFWLFRTTWGFCLLYHITNIYIIIYNHRDMIWLNAINESQDVLSSCSELNVSLVDPGLTIAVTKNIAKTVQLFCVKSEHLVRAPQWLWLKPGKIPSSLFPLRESVIMICVI